jgi:hypothetical protein
MFWACAYVGGSLVTFPILSSHQCARAMTSFYLATVKVKKLHWVTSYSNVMESDFPVMTWLHRIDEKTCISLIFKSYYRLFIYVLGVDCEHSNITINILPHTLSSFSLIDVCLQRSVSQGNVEYLLKWKGWPPKWVSSLWCHHHIQ